MVAAPRRWVSLRTVSDDLGRGPTTMGESDPSFEPLPPPGGGPEPVDPPDADVTSRASGARAALEWVVVIAGAVAVALIIKTFLLQAFYIPSESMEPTLVKNDRVLVNKLAYRVGDVSRGDVIVFEKPESDVTAVDIKDLIKRVVGVPGDAVTFDQGRVQIDGEPLDEPYLAPGTVTNPGTGTIDPLDPASGPHSCEPTDPCIVPEGYVFVMGDNRGNSQDSRYTQVGYIDQDAIVGKAFVRVWPLNRLSGL